MSHHKASKSHKGTAPHQWIACDLAVSRPSKVPQEEGNHLYLFKTCSVGGLASDAFHICLYGQARFRNAARHGAMRHDLRLLCLVMTTLGDDGEAREAPVDPRDRA